MKKARIILLTIGLTAAIGTAYFYLHKKITQKTVVIALYDRFNLLDAVGAYQTASGLMLENYAIKFAARNKGRVPSGYLQSLKADYSFEDISSADILILPGSEDYRSVLEDQSSMDWIRKMDKQSEQTLAIGSGTVILASTGALKGKKVCTGWHEKDVVESFGAEYVEADYVHDGKYYTGAGASASIDMVLALINDVYGAGLAKTTQLFIAYDPNPPVNSGFYQDADSAVRTLATAMPQHTVAPSEAKKTIAIYLYNGFTMLDVSGPYQVFRELEPYGYEMKFISDTKGIVQSDFIQSLEAPFSVNDVNEAQIFFVPGGSTTYKILDNTSLINWIRGIDRTTDFTISVCTGSVLLGEAKLLKGKRATSHWFVGPKLTEFGIQYTGERYTRDGKYITGAGVSAGVDLALFIVEQLEGEEVAKAIQLRIGYFPHPPFDAGSPEKSDPATVEMLSKMLLGATQRNNTGAIGIREKSVQTIPNLDPVCHMDVVETYTDSITYNGITYGFCSAMCKELFMEKPEKYLLK
ncbi:MAG: DJ-1/PfpI family protein [Bacteroidetes bacterium]|nr:DJ-1/PfpI family protein [Bacteroidota bacterium]